MVQPLPWHLVKEIYDGMNMAGFLNRKYQKIMKNGDFFKEALSRDFQPQ